MSLTTQSIQKSFCGYQGVYTHHSEITHCEMTFSVYQPEKAEKHDCAVLYYLSGLTCSHENVTVKGGFQKYANEAGVIVVCPDTSPRGTTHPGEHDCYDFGSGAGFYLNAIEPPWNKNYNMYSYVTQELPELIEQNFKADPERTGIFGHSMGGHGALTIGLKNPQKYLSISAFAPIVAPMSTPWGQKAFEGYLGDDKVLWSEFDACELVKRGCLSPNRILIDQGTADDFLEEQLKPQLFVEICKEKNQPLQLRMQQGYDHSYFFISTFMADHIAFHAQILNT
ncbi:S-formylglutathione hydrolase [Aliikangiella sp. G2MR2-5]|uniref:S-formylglutathione hydrolase n=1 Tax=Aliikangiella sp. G2MR2-5 TaxID=2788943 RepID=UPI0018AB52E9|nr:S-formylglutathione hydrolase [Aliikangiella sp. G2MR2-5]